MVWKIARYFPMWLKSAGYNPDIDFLILSDQEIKDLPGNVSYEKTSMEREILRFEHALKKKITIRDSYKFCDLRPFFGITYEKFLQDYDFWGYCDVDLAFGQVRSFITDEILDNYDRIYDLGLLCLFRNTEEINHIWEMGGSIYSDYDIFRSKGKATSEEYYGLNLICEKNPDKVRWYKKREAADFVKYLSNYEISFSKDNKEYQVFYWEDGHVYRAYWENNGMRSDEYVYIHWQKRKPDILGDIKEGRSFFITPRVIIEKDEGLPSPEQIIRYNSPLTSEEKQRQRSRHIRNKIKEFIRSNGEHKFIWIKQKITHIKRYGKIVDD